MPKKIPNCIILFVALSFFVIIGFGFSHSLGMEMEDDGTMGGCIFVRQAGICPMTFAEHISQWQGMMRAIPQESNILIQLFVLVSAFTLSILGAGRQVLLLLSNYFRERERLYIRNNPHLPLFDPLQEAFSRGFLNPKIYHTAVL